MDVFRSRFRPVLPLITPVAGDLLAFPSIFLSPHRIRGVDRSCELLGHMVPGERRLHLDVRRRHCALIPVGDTSP